MERWARKKFTAVKKTKTHKIVIRLESLLYVSAAEVEIPGSKYKGRKKSLGENGL